MVKESKMYLSCKCINKINKPIDKGTARKAQVNKIKIGKLALSLGVKKLVKSREK